jgi:hypothetical protein
LLLLSVALCLANIYPIQFSISETKIVQDMPEKNLDFATLIPGDVRTYIYTEEEEYYKDYQRSFFALTCKKGGWDCLRHYEILANGCIPYFVDLDQCDPNTMIFLPKDLILEAMHLDGVDYLKIDHTKLNKEKYYEILNKLLEYTRTHLTGKNIGKYLLETIHYSGSGKILYLTSDVAPDYLRCCTLIGLKELLGNRIVDYPKIEHIYKSYSGNVQNLYGKGFTYTKVVDDVPIDRENIEEQILRHDFDLIIYGSVHRGTPYHELVQWVYEPDQIIYLCGEDDHRCPYTHLPHLFLREFSAK